MGRPAERVIAFYNKGRDEWIKERSIAARLAPGLSRLVKGWPHSDPVLTEQALRKKKSRARPPSRVLL